MKYSFCLILILFIAQYGLAQSTEVILERNTQLTQAGQYQEAIQLLEAAINKDVTDSLLTIFYHELGVNYFQLGNDQKAVEYWLMETKRLRGKNTIDLARVLRNIGISYGYLGELNQAESSLQESIQIHNGCETIDTTLLGNTYLDLGYVLTQQADFQKAEESLKQAKSIYLLAPKNNIQALGDTFSDLFWLCYQKNNFVDALNNMKEAVSYYQELPLTDIEDTTIIADYYHNLGLAYHSLELIDSALVYYQKSLNLNESYPKLRKEVLAENYNNLAIIYIDQNNLSKARSLLSKSISINSEQNNALQLADNLDNLAEIHLKAGQNEDALLSINQAIQYLIPTYKDIRPSSILEFDKDNLVVGDRPKLAQVLLDKARILFTLAKREEPVSTKYLLASVKTYQSAIQLVEDIRTSFDAIASKHLFSATSRQSIGQAILANYEAFQFTADTICLNNILTLMSQSRAVSLLDELKLEQTLKKAGIPSYILDRDRDLQKEVIQLETEIFNENDSLLPILIKKRHEYKLFKNDTLSKYSSLVSWKQPLEIQYHTIQKELLSSDQGLISYFVADSILFNLYIDSDTVLLSAHKIPHQFINHINRLNELVSDKTSKIEEFQEVTDMLYDILLATPLSLLAKKSSIERLVIIPDQELARIPFEVLPYQSVNSKLRFTSYPYLISKYAISYAHSSSVLMLQQTYVLPEVHQLGAFYVSDYNQFNLPNLSALDAQTAHSLLGGEIHDNALLSDFKQQSSKYSLMHISVHGFGSGRNEQQSHLVFKDSTLSASDIYAMKFDAAMVVLSGCETGEGELQRGEGIISLAHAFAYAGTSSTIMSLWKLSDHTANKLFETFYDKITNENLPKDIALREAKLDLMQTHPQFYHPYYWSVLIASGDQSPIHIKQHWTIALQNLLAILLRDYWKTLMIVFVFIGVTASFILKRRSTIA